MVRLICALAGILAFAAPAVRPDVDAVTFALAFRDGRADQFKNTAVAGSGMSFHGAIKERIADGSTRTSLVITLGAVDANGSVAPLKTWDSFVAAERDRTTLVVALSGPDLPTPSSSPATYEFRGVYDGQVRTIVRAPQAADATVPDSGPCAGEQPRRDADPKASFYCAPLLTGASVKSAK